MALSNIEIKLFQYFPLWSDCKNEYSFKNIKEVFFTNTYGTLSQRIPVFSRLLMKPSHKRTINEPHYFLQFPVCHICLFLKPHCNFKKHVWTTFYSRLHCPQGPWSASSRQQRSIRLPRWQMAAFWKSSDIWYAFTVVRVMLVTLWPDCSNSPGSPHLWFVLQRLVPKASCSVCLTPFKNNPAIDWYLLCITCEALQHSSLSHMFSPLVFTMHPWDAHGSMATLLLTRFHSNSLVENIGIHAVCTLDSHLSLIIPSNVVPNGAVSPYLCSTFSSCQKHLPYSSPPIHVFYPLKVNPQITSSRKPFSTKGLPGNKVVFFLYFSIYPVPDIYMPINFFEINCYLECFFIIICCFGL